MSNPNQPQPWTPLAMLRPQYAANIEALRLRDGNLADAIDAAAPAEPYFLTTAGNQVLLGRAVDNALQPLPNPVPPVAAAQVVAKLFPTGECTEPVTVAGIDQGWIWDALHKLECKSALPMHRPPMYFLCHDVTRLWAALHFQNWTDLLADPRVMIFAGRDAAARYRDTLTADPRLPLPRLSLTVEPAIWQSGNAALASADTIYNGVLREWDATLKRTLAKLQSIYPGNTTTDIAGRIAKGEKLRVLGITSRYTTFLQHSMRDWLSSFRALGHETKLVIEAADFHTNNNVVYLGDVAAFRPDLIVIIDHYRAEYAGLPAGVPVAMWVQDRLPNIFNPAAGAAQGPLDFCLGFGRLHLSQNHGYPADRFLPAPIGVNEHRFSTAAISDAERARFACDASFVSHHSTPAETLLAKQLEQIAQPESKRLMTEVFECMRAHYEGGGDVLVDAAIRRIINETATSLGLSVPASQLPTIEHFFSQPIANALFRHTSLKWVADSGVNLHLYGRGWENHPYFKRFARGVADNASQLASIYGASTINLQITPFGAVHQRLLDGLAGGAFFLARYSQGDAVGAHYVALWNACVARNITNDAQLSRETATDADLATLVQNVLSFEGSDFATCGFKLYDVTAAHADSDFMVAAGSIWPEYGDIAFRSSADCAEKLSRYLNDDAERLRVARSMRATMINRASYTNTSRRLLNLMAERLPQAIDGNITTKAVA
ncbi:MAG TPA: glycosyltransferase [Tepidisphaeraceae bacterium]|jgi:hypothetical protein|nr:glycosyltransferase [Tepidisphaeraceae bacterium]